MFSSVYLKLYIVTFKHGLYKILRQTWGCKMAYPTFRMVISLQRSKKIRFRWNHEHPTILIFIKNNWSQIRKLSKTTHTPPKDTVFWRNKYIQLNVLLSMSSTIFVSIFTYFDAVLLAFRRRCYPLSLSLLFRIVDVLIHKWYGPFYLLIKKKITVNTIE